MRLDPADELTELVPLDEAATVAQVSRRTITRWITAGRLTVYEVSGLRPGSPRRYVLESALLDVEHERRAARHGGRDVRGAM